MFTARSSTSVFRGGGFLRGGLGAVFLLLAGADSRADEFDFFEKRIRPVLVERCYSCHSASSEKLKGGLRLDSREGMLQGGNSGRPALVPRDAERSLLIEAIRRMNPDLQMPPKEPLSAAQVADFASWINSGAPDPRTVESLASQSKGSATGHWAFQPVKQPPVPPVKDRRFVRTPVDAFILAKLEAKGLPPSPPADQRTLLRRATYDLTGLPPTLEEVKAFLADTAPDAFARVVDRLLASPHYGERWGRHWLDVARYADTKGYVYSDREDKRFVHAHVYRDWVVRAFNDDMPYDQFLEKQIAADLLAPAEGATRADLAALGFLTVGRRFLGVQHDIIDDRIDVLTRGTMGLTVACARCHDHKYDPVPTRDYYSLYGVFSSCSEQTVPLADSAVPAGDFEKFSKGLKEREDRRQQTFEKKRAQFTDRLRLKTPDYLLAVLDVSKLHSEEFYVIAGPDDLNPAIIRQWEAHLFKTRRTFDPVFAPWHACADLPAKDFAEKASAALARLATETNAASRINPLVRRTVCEPVPQSMKEVAERYGRVFTTVDKAWREALQLAATNKTAPPSVLAPDEEQIRQVLYASGSPASIPDGAIVDTEWFFDEGSRVELAKLQMEIDKWLIESPGAPPYSVILADRPQPKNARVFLRGNPASRGDEVPRQFLEVTTGPNRLPFQHGSGRLDMARAIASPGNPLTARVMVNRVWLHHFGAGLVRTPSDFGTRAEPPSHPGLLDWLASRFVEDGWSIKKLHRLILNSATYQQRSDGAADRTASVVDPGNTLLWRMNRRRLDFESLRDSLLAVTGELDRRIGGKPAEMFGKKPATRRAIYGLVDRQFVPGTLRLFDFANPDLHIPQRAETTVPQQALFFLNSPFVIDRARALATRAEVAAAAKPADKVRRIYTAVHQRPPTRQELETASDFLRATQNEPPPPPPPTPPPSPWQYGFGAFDEAAQRTTNFALLPHFTGGAWQGGDAWPDAKLGWAQLTAEGGHAGNDLQHAAIRRWTAPRDGKLKITGTVRHEEPNGDGITVRIISSRAGALGKWDLHKTKHDVLLENVEVRAGDTLDFAVDIRGNLNSDNFKWAPVIEMTGDSAAGGEYLWNAARDFSGPMPPPPEPLSPVEKLAQVLLLSNEFVFVD